jgi:Zn-dependent protease
LRFAVCLLPLTTLIHESGHALAALAAGRRIAEVVVGDDQSLLRLRNDRFRFRLGAVTGRGHASGYVVFDGGGAKPRDVLLIALAGPLASLAGAVACCVLAAWAWPEPALTFALLMGAVAGWAACADNLRISGDGPDDWSDGVWVRGAWRAMRRPAGWADPHETTSVAPPG